MIMARGTRAEPLGHSDIADIGTNLVPLERPSRTIERRYEDLLFVHFRMPPDLVRPWIPSRLDLELFDGDAWLGMVAGRAHNVRTRSRRPGTTRRSRSATFARRGTVGAGCPEVPQGGSRAAHELSVRTYVEGGGIYLLDLSLDQALSLWTAERLLNLRCHRARMVQLREGRAFAFSACSPGDPGPRSELVVTWTAGRSSATPSPGTLERFYSDREWVHSLEQDVRVELGPLRLANVRLSTFQSTVLESLGFPAPKGGPIVHHASEQSSLLALPGG